MVEGGSLRRSQGVGRLEKGEPYSSTDPHLEVDRDEAQGSGCCVEDPPWLNELPGA